MRGVATTSAAVSVVNALPLGVGAAFAIDWPARATASPARPGARGLSVEPRSAATPLVRSAAAAALTRFGRTRHPLRLSVRSTIPRARGLKSSSAVSGAVALATARLCGAVPTAEEIARLAADVERRTGRSATGAFDDALASVEGGGVVTDNRFDRTLTRFDLPTDLAVALWVPTAPHPPSARLRSRFRKTPELARRAVEAALDGDWGAAMTANTALVERAMGYRYEHLHAAAQRAGAIGSGVSGMGPTFAAVAPSKSILRVVRSLPKTGGLRRAVRLSVRSSSARRSAA